MYKISIDKLEQAEDEKYPRATEIYQQTVETLSIEAVIKAVNSLNA